MRTGRWEQRLHWKALFVLIIGLYSSLLGIGFQCRRVNRDRLPLNQAFSGQYPDDPFEDSLVGLQPVQTPRPGDRRVIRRLLVETKAQESAQRKGVCHPPGNATFRVQPFEVANQQRAEVNPRGHARPSILALLIELPAKKLHLLIKLMLVQDAV